jgi:flagellar basal body-associated protein FliL
MSVDGFITNAKSSGVNLLNTLGAKKEELRSQVRDFRDNNDIKDILAAAKLNEILKKDEEEEEMSKKSPIVTILAIIGAVVAVACIAFAVYKYFTPDYLDDFDEGDDDFDDEDELFEDEDEVVKEN